ncbi:unnamed protein product [Vicia faba]|uniref:Uncharacterized protein n=1 Tax=Vicia faba TaxID=3906 RepID=A0AAV0YVK5_VICFA|nr:unnamed protein product [Vicia faba]
MISREQQQQNKFDRPLRKFDPLCIHAHFTAPTGHRHRHLRHLRHLRQTVTFVSSFLRLLRLFTGAYKLLCHLLHTILFSPFSKERNKLVWTEPETPPEAFGGRRGRKESSFVRSKLEHPTQLETLLNNFAHLRYFVRRTRPEYRSSQCFY